MRTLASDVLAAIHERNQRGVVAFLVKVPIDDATTRYLTTYPATITYSSQDYLAFPIRFGNIRETSETDMPTFEISVANVDRSIVVDLEGGDILGRVLEVTAVLIPAANAALKVLYTGSYEILDAVVTKDKAYVVFRVGRFNLYQADLPPNRWLDFRCGFVFRDTHTCGFPNDEFKALTGGDLKIGGDGEKWQQWFFRWAANATSADIHQTTASKLTIVMPVGTNITWASSPPNAPFLYKKFAAAENDVDFEVQFSGDSDEDFEAEGIVIAEDSDSPDDYIGLFRRHDASPKLLYVVNLTGGSSDTVPSSVNSTDTILRIKKTGTTFEFFHRASLTAAWTSMGTVTKSSLSGDIRVGISGETRSIGRTTPFTLEADFFHVFAGGSQSCNRTLTRCSELKNTRRYGGAPGILHGPLQL